MFQVKLKGTKYNLTNPNLGSLRSLEITLQYYCIIVPASIDQLNFFQISLRGGNLSWGGVRF
jgi:hypothetical protein